jgi:hypothetical protein
VLGNLFSIRAGWSCLIKDLGKAQVPPLHLVRYQIEITVTHIKIPINLPFLHQNHQITAMYGHFAPHAKL